MINVLCFRGKFQIGLHRKIGKHNAKKRKAQQNC